MYLEDLIKKIDTDRGIRETSATYQELPVVITC